jgi:integrase
LIQVASPKEEPEMIALYKRHVADCQHKDQPQHRRCHCPIWFQTNRDGKQTRWSSKERSWDAAERKARKLEQAEASGHNIHSTRAAGLTDVIEAFLTDKEKGSDPVAADTLYRHESVLTLLKDFCAGRGITLLKDITLSVVTEWQHTWTLKSPAAKRGRQEKVRNFFRFTVNHEYISKNPISAWKSVKLNTNELHVSEDRIIRPKVYARIMKAVDEVPMTPESRERVKACMRLQREAGLAIVDAVGLSKDELTKEAGRFRVKTSRQKTGTSVNNPITEELGQLLLKVKNGNPKYFFASGNTLPEDAPSYFQKLYRKVFKKAGVEHTSHDLRPTYAATFLEAGGDIRLLSKALGHSSITVTEKYYAHFTKKQQDMLDKAAENALAAMGD